MATKLQARTQTNQSNSEDRVAINVALPKPLHQQLRIKAIENDYSLTQAIAAAVESWVK